MKKNLLFHASILLSTAWASPELSWAFFARLGDKLVPGSHNAYPGISPGVSVFSYGDFAKAAEFTFRDGYAVSKTRPTDERVGIYDNFFSVGSAVSPTKLELDNKMQVLNAIYYSCASTNNMNVITDKILSDHCTKVDIYFLNYDKKTGSAVMPRLPQKKEKEFLSVSRHLPYVFFAKIGDTLVPLGSRTYQRNGIDFNLMCYGQNVGDPVEFIVQGNSAISRDTSNNGYIGIYDWTLVFGRTIHATDLMLDGNRRVHNANYLSCSGPDNAQFITTVSFFDDCFAVEIYLLLEETDAAIASTKPLPSGTKNVSEKQSVFGHVKKKVLKQDENEVFWNTASEKNEMFSEPTGVNLLSGDPNLPYVFFANTEGDLLPLSARVVPHYGINFRVMYSYFETGKPTEFIMENNYAHSINTPNDGYFGIYENIAVFGPNIPRMKLTLDTDSKVINTKFYSCWDDQDNEVFSVEMINEYCADVEIYFLHRDQVTRRPVLDASSMEGENIRVSKMNGNTINEATWEHKKVF